MQGRLRQRAMISSAWLVRVLATSSRSHRCSECGARMFVESSSRRCPVCVSRSREIESIALHQARAAFEE